MAALYKVYSAAVPTTAHMVPIATGTAIKTLLQLTAPATNDIVIVAWGIDFTTVPTAFVNCELINTTTVAGTGATAVTPTPVSDAGAAASVAGFAPTAEGTVAATTRVFDEKQMLTNSYAWEWSLGREPEMSAGQVLRVRTITTVSVNAIAWIMFGE